MRTVHAGTVRNYGPSTTDGGVAPGKRSDPSCFADRANMGNDSFKPECAKCLSPAIGAILVEMEEPSAISVEFRCRQCGPGPNGFVLTTGNLSTWGDQDSIMEWVPVAKTSPGIYRMRKST